MVVAGMVGWMGFRIGLRVKRLRVNPETDIHVDIYIDVYLYLRRQHLKPSLGRHGGCRHGRVDGPPYG